MGGQANTDLAGYVETHTGEIASSSLAWTLEGLSRDGLDKPWKGRVRPSSPHPYKTKMNQTRLRRNDAVAGFLETLLFDEALLGHLATGGGELSILRP